MPALLEAQELEAQYGWTKVLHGLSFAVETGGITTILGANGAGKTTTLRAVCGMVRTAGEITLAGRRIEGRATEDVVRLGVAHVPEGRGTFVQLTVEENLRLGAYARRDRRELAAEIERVCRYFPVLAERRRQVAGTLSGGEQQMLAVARALMLRPRLLLLDEPSLGLSPLIVTDMFAAIRRIHAAGTSVLLVEQNVAMAMDVCDRAYVLEEGRIVAEGEPETLMGRPEIQRAYLGL